MPFSDPRKLADAITRQFADEGKIIEAGFAAFSMTAMHPNAPPDQVREMRLAFFAGAQHLFGSIMNTLDPEEEPTDADMRRLDLINAELNQFIKDFTKQHLPTKGQA